VADPKIADNSGITIPRWNEAASQFNDGSSTIRQVFEKLVEQYGKLPSDSPAIDAAEPNHMAQDDILGKKRSGTSPDIGAFEFRKGLLTPVYLILLED